jgi:hypothetical protein
MDPLGVITTLASIISYLRQVAAKVKRNQSMCVELGDHVESLLAILKRKNAQTLPKDLSKQLGPLLRCVPVVHKNAFIDNGWIQSASEYCVKFG